MQWRVAVPGVLGAATVAVAALLVFAPGAIASYAPGTVEAFPTGDGIWRALTAGLAFYVGWVVLSRTHLLPLRKVRSATDTGAGVHTDTRDSPPSTDEQSTAETDKASRPTEFDGRSDHVDGDGAATESRSDAVFSVLGIDIFRYRMRSEGGTDGEGGESTADDPTLDRLEEGESEEDTRNTEEAAPPPAGDTSAPISIRPSEFDALRENPPETAGAGTADIVGGDFEAAVSDRVHASDAVRPYAEVDIQEGLRETLVTAEEQSRGRTPTAVATEVDEGTWTDDPVAAAFLGAEGSVSLPLRERLRAWIAPRRTFERAVDRTVDAIERRLEQGENR